MIATQGTRPFLAGLALSTLAPHQVSAQIALGEGETTEFDPQTTSAGPRRSDDDAIATAQDAFGTSVGRESLGLYEAEDVRGFSPLAAGNARIDGMFFDPVVQPNARLQASNSIQVGIAAQGNPFIAPTGIVDFGLRKPETNAASSIVVSGDIWGSGSVEVDGTLPLTQRLTGGFGAQAGRQEFGDGTRETISSQAVLLRWRPVSSIDATVFWSRSEFSGARPSPIYLSDIGLPNMGPRRSFTGPDWARAHIRSGTAGVIATASLSPRLRASFGSFRSHNETLENYTLLRTDFADDDSYRQLVLADLPQKSRSNSGEARLSREFDDGERRHQVHLSFRFRDRLQEFGGSTMEDLGRHKIDAPIAAPRPGFVFGHLSHDAVRQWSAGLAYQGEWRGVGQLGLGFVRTSYQKKVRLPDGQSVVSTAQPWLLSAAGAWHLTSDLSIYSSFAQGLEESEEAPETAVNRGQPVPAIRTRQVDGGFRWRIGPGISAVLGAFQLERPYFTLDAADRYVQIGSIRNRGIELSVTGALTPRLTVVFGTLLQSPRVIGRMAGQEQVGPRPVGLVPRISTLNIDWRPAMLAGVSLDLSLASRGREVSTIDNGVTIPGRTTAALGGRYRFGIGKRTAVLRLTLANITDERGHVSKGPGAYVPLEGRQLSGYLTIDF